MESSSRNLLLLVLCGFACGCTRTPESTTAPREAVVKQPTKCEIILDGRDKASKDCSSGNFGACQDIAGWTREVIMEGCTSSGSRSDGNASTDESEVEEDAAAQSYGDVADSTENENPDEAIVRSESEDAEMPSTVAESSASGPSFTCRAGLSPSEATICGDSSLASLDSELSHSYQTALHATDAKQDAVRRSYLVSMQRQWLKERNKQCGADAACLEEFMKSRIDELDAK